MTQTPAAFKPSWEPTWLELQPSGHQARAAFEKFLSLGEQRSMRACAALLGLKSHSYLVSWAKTHDWKRRAADYDAAQRTDQETLNHAALQAKHHQVAEDLLDMASRELARLKDAAQGGAPVSVELAQVARIADQASKMSRLALGLSTSNNSSRVHTTDETPRESEDDGMDYSLLTLEEMWILKSIAAKGRGEVGWQQWLTGVDPTTARQYTIKALPSG